MYRNSSYNEEALAPGYAYPASHSRYVVGRSNH